MRGLSWNDPYRIRTWEELVNTAKELANAAGRKATDIADLAKMKLKLAENEKAIEATLAALGRLMYEGCMERREPDDVLVIELVDQVKELEAANEQLRAEIDNNRGRKTCRECGTANPEGASFCNGCGKPLA